MPDGKASMPSDSLGRTLILGTAGHIDHGKTALVRALTGTDTDRLPEERQRRMTIDIGFARLDLGDVELGIVDVPGHERFISNMLAGATGIDLAMLVVAADDAVMPQTREHLELLELLDVRCGLVAITKCDLADEQLLELVQDDVADLTASTFLQGVPVLPTSAVTLAGLDDLKSALGRLARRIRPRGPGELFRLAVDRAFALPGQGTVVTGSVASGTLGLQDPIQWMPEGKTLRVRSLHSHGRPVASIHRGQRAAIGLAGVHHSQIVRKHELATPGFLKATRLLTARLDLSPTCPWPLRHRTPLRLHIGTGQYVAVVSLLATRRLMPGESAIVQLFVTEPVVAVCGQPFVVRSLSPAHTLGGGHVLEPEARRILRHSGHRVDQVRALDSSSPADRVSAALGACHSGQWTELDLCRNANVDLPEVRSLLARLKDAGTLIELATGPRRILRLHARTVARWEARILQALGHHHTAEPLQLGLAPAALADRLGLAHRDLLLAALLARLLKQGKVRITGDRLAQSTFAPQMDARQATTYQQILAAYRQGGFQPPSTTDLARRLDAGDALMRRLLDLAVAQGKLCHLAGGLYLDAEAEHQMRTCIGQKLALAGGLTVSQIRQLLQTSRKYAIPFCEYLDRIGMTRRSADDRRTLAGPAAGIQPPTA